MANDLFLAVARIGTLHNKVCRGKHITAAVAEGYQHILTKYVACAEAGERYDYLVICIIVPIFYRAGVHRAVLAGYGKRGQALAGHHEHAFGGVGKVCGNGNILINALCQQQLVFAFFIQGIKALVKVFAACGIRHCPADQRAVGGGGGAQLYYACAVGLKVIQPVGRCGGGTLGGVLALHGHLYAGGGIRLKLRLYGEELLRHGEGKSLALGLLFTQFNAFYLPTREGIAFVGGGGNGGGICTKVHLFAVIILSAVELYRAVLGIYLGKSLSPELNGTVLQHVAAFVNYAEMICFCPVPAIGKMQVHRADGSNWSSCILHVGEHI